MVLMRVVAVQSMKGFRLPTEVEAVLEVPNVLM
jgi:hypothetical protein